VSTAGSLTRAGGKSQVMMDTVFVWQQRHKQMFETNKHILLFFVVVEMDTLKAADKVLGKALYGIKQRAIWCA
jgi:hypothetical protein